MPLGLKALFISALVPASATYEIPAPFAPFNSDLGSLLRPLPILKPAAFIFLPTPLAVFLIP